MCFPLQENSRPAPAGRPEPFAVDLRPMLIPTPPASVREASRDPGLTGALALGAEPKAAAGRGSRPGTGRPRKDPGQGRTAQLHVLVTPDEREVVHRAAADAGLSVSAFLRRRALGQPVTARADAQTRAALRRVGVNLNQLARIANGTAPLGGASGVGPALAARLDAAISDVFAAVDRLSAGPCDAAHPQVQP